MKQASLAAGLSHTYVRDVIKRGRGKYEHLEQVAACAGLSWEWLRTGNGDMMAKTAAAGVAEEARVIALEKKRWPEFAAQVEWTKFREWFKSQGATKRRWFEEWPKWLDAAEHGQATAPQNGFDPTAKIFSCYKLGMSMGEIKD
jgi:hypothetical protein